MADRAAVFIDGNNWYHGLRDAGLTDLFELDYKKVSEKLLGPRTWVCTNYYIGRVKQTQGQRLYADQRRFLAALRNTDPRINVREGRIEPRPEKNELAAELRSYLGNLPTAIDRNVYQDLMNMAIKYNQTTVYVEKAVDVKLAVDMVTMAHNGEYDACYLLSADGDYTPAVEAVRNLNKRVYVASAQYGHQLAQAVQTFIHLPPGWFRDCYT